MNVKVLIRIVTINSNFIFETILPDKTAGLITTYEAYLDKFPNFDPSSVLQITLIGKEELS